jgi:hypothetical protein
LDGGSFLALIAPAARVIHLREKPVLFRLLSCFVRYFQKFSLLSRTNAVDLSCFWSQIQKDSRTKAVIRIQSISVVATVEIFRCAAEQNTVLFRVNMKNFSRS